MFTKDEVIQLISSLVKIKSPYFKEDEIMDFAYNWLKSQGLFPRFHTYEEHKALDFNGKNVILNLKGRETGRRVCLNGHLDTVPVCDGWTRDPFGAEIEGDKLYGLGALDMKSGCAANMIAVAQFFNEYGDDFKGEVSLSLVSDEEGPFGLGTNALIEDGTLNEFDVALITEPTAGFSNEKNFPLLCLGARGCFVYYIDFLGQAAHASTPERGLNAAIEAAKFVLESEKLKLKEVEPLGKGSFCILKFLSDGGSCSVPDKARVFVHRHVTMGETEETVFKEAEELIKAAGVKCNYEFGVRPYPSEGSRCYTPYYVKEDNYFVGLMKEAVKEATGVSSNLGYFASIGDFNYIGTRLNHVPALVFGPTGENFHSFNEYVDLQSAYETAVTVYEFLKKTLL